MSKPEETERPSQEQHCPVCKVAVSFFGCCYNTECPGNDIKFMQTSDPGGIRTSVGASSSEGIMSGRSGFDEDWNDPMRQYRDEDEAERRRREDEARKGAYFDEDYNKETTFPKE